jgi:hypothetical protein
MKELPQIAARSTRTRICPADGEEVEAVIALVNSPGPSGLKDRK